MRATRRARSRTDNVANYGWHRVKATQPRLAREARRAFPHSVLRAVQVPEDVVFDDAGAAFVVASFSSSFTVWLSFTRTTAISSA